MLAGPTETRMLSSGLTTEQASIRVLIHFAGPKYDRAEGEAERDADEIVRLVQDDIDPLDEAPRQFGEFALGEKSYPLPRASHSGSPGRC